MAIEITGTFGPTGTNAGSPAGFATHEANFGLGGYMQVADDAARDAISDIRRAEGMAVYVNDTDKLYILKDGVTNNNWVEFSGGTGGSIDITDGTTTISQASELDLAADNFTVTQGTTATKAQVTSAFNTSIDPATSVAIDVNSLNNLTAADFNGLSMTAVFNKILFPTLAPAYTQPTATLTRQPVTTTFEVGSSVSNTLTLELIKNDSGGYDQVTPTITRVGAGNLLISGVITAPFQNLSPQYGYANANIPNQKYTCTATDSFTMPLGNVSYTSSIGYSAGNELKDSTGVDSGPAIAAGSLSPTNPGVTGIYPYFWGLIPVANLTQVYATAIQEVVAEIQNGNATKEVADSENNISVPFNATAGVNFMFFATPATSTTKTVWFETALNTGAIAGTDFADPNKELFSAPSTQAITTTLWSNVNYKVYVALKSSDSTTIQLKNN